MTTSAVPASPAAATVRETVTVDRLGHKGDGVAATATGDVFVTGTLPGETVTIDRAGGRGRLVEIVVPSPDRVAPVCPHVGSCGGCALQHMAEPAYRAFKRRLVADALADRGIVAEVGAAWIAPPASRRRAVIAVQHQADGLVAGLRERLGHTVVAIPDCRLFTPAITALLPALPRLVAPFTFGRKGATVTVLDTATGLDVAVGDAELKPERRQEAITRALAAGLARLSLGADILVESRAPVVAFGAIEVALPPGAFLQAVAAGEGELARHVVAATAGAKRVADLFAGAGTFALRLAATARVHAVEADKPALASLDRAWRRSAGLKTVTTEARDLYRRPLLPAELKAYDAVVFDPPRDGAAPQAKELAKSAVPVVVAVSCNPATLARDLRYLLDAGYRLDPVAVVDQFLWSHHVEAVAVLRR
jgi:23S rRNA (uracil1939-C5)-methyltransferase